MNDSQYRVLLVVVCLLALGAAPLVAQTPTPTTRPWESPNFGSMPTLNTPTTNPNGWNRIETVTQTSGASLANGQQVSNAGNTKDRTFVTTSLNDAASKIGNSQGSAYAWSWSKSWDSNGKTTETWQVGTLNTKPTGTPPAGGSSGPSSNSFGGAPPAAPPTPAGPVTAPAGSGPSTGPGGSTTGPTGTGPGAGSTGPAGTPPAKPTTGGPLEIGVPAIPAPPVTLSVLDQVTQSEQLVTSLNKRRLDRPVPEDVRTRFGLEIDKQIDPKDVTVQILEKENDMIPPKTAADVGVALQHTFRTPSDTDYRAIVTYNDPRGGARKLIDVVIPVTAVSMKSQQLDAQTERLQQPTAAGQGATGDNRGNGITAAIGNNQRGASAVAGGADSSRGSVDVSDLYVPAGQAMAGGANANNSGAAGAAYAGGQTGAAGGAANQIGGDNRAAGAGGSSNNGGGTGGNNGAAMANAASTGNRGAGGTGGQSGNRSNVSGNSGTTGNNGGSANTNRGGATGNTGDGATAAATGNAGNGGNGGNGGDNGGAGGDNNSYAAGNSDSSGNSANTSPDGLDGQQVAMANTGAGGASTNRLAGTHGNVEFNGANNGAAGGADGANAGGIAHAQFGANHSGGVTTGANQQAATTDDPLKKRPVSVFLRDNKTKAVQAFYFDQTPMPTAAPVTAKGQIDFTVACDANVARDSVGVEVFDGAAKREIRLDQCQQDSFAHIFDKGANDQPYVWVFGKTKEGGQFSYKVFLTFN